MVKCTRCGHYEADHSPSRPGCALCECADFDPVTAPTLREAIDAYLAREDRKVYTAADAHPIGEPTPDDKALAEKHARIAREVYKEERYGFAVKTAVARALAEQREQHEREKDHMRDAFEVGVNAWRERAEAAEVERDRLAERVAENIEAMAERDVRLSELEADGRRLQWYNDNPQAIDYRPGPQMWTSGWQLDTQTARAEGKLHFSLFEAIDAAIAAEAHEADCAINTNARHGCDCGAAEEESE